ncbi:hypothetical protein SDJN03_07239, partial [Cucurbita argyrosperma subsp. sororia]
MDENKNVIFYWASYNLTHTLSPILKLSGNLQKKQKLDGLDAVCGPYSSSNDQDSITATIHHQNPEKRTVASTQMRHKKTNKTTPKSSLPWRFVSPPSSISVLQQSRDTKEKLSGELPPCQSIARNFLDGSIGFNLLFPFHFPIGFLDYSAIRYF